MRGRRIARGLLAALTLAVLPVLGAPEARAQNFAGLARVDMASSQVRDEDADLVVELALSQTVPWRVFTLDAPRRLVLDFRTIDWTGVTRSALLNSDLASDLRFGAFRPGWSRLVIDLSAPLRVETAALTTDQDSGRARLTVRLRPTDAEDFAARAGVSRDTGFADELPPVSLPAAPADDGVLTVVIDPGHGGIDPGAIRDGVVEADLMLRLGIEVAEALNRSGLARAVLTRDDDSFVSLEERMSIARAARADLLISLHADALEEDEAQGASVYTLNAEGEDRAARRMAERHERGDLLAGLDLSGQDDRIATVLMEMARHETGPQSDRFADTLVDAMRAADTRVNSRPRREGRLAVLNAADFASVLVEVGFLSSALDRATLSSAEGRARIAAAIVLAVQRWSADEAVRAPLVRQ